ncbi:hypothetical protein AGMMS49921_08660 [Endomicrobiia bacterium]|nr:hypothetical protein AGMMS49921_08660 [Endomicrobiia bacterium]
MSAWADHTCDINHIKKKEVRKSHEKLIKAFPDVTTDIVNDNINATVAPFYTFCAAYYAARAQISAALAAGYANRTCTPKALSAARKSIALADDAANYSHLAFTAKTPDDAKTFAYKTIVASIDANQFAIDVRDAFNSVRAAMNNDDPSAAAKDVAVANDAVSAAYAYMCLAKATTARISNAQPHDLYALDRIVVISYAAAFFAACYANNSPTINDNIFSRATAAQIAYEHADFAFSVINLLLAKVPVTDVAKAFFKKAQDLEMKRFNDRNVKKISTIKAKAS